MVEPGARMVVGVVLTQAGPHDDRAHQAHLDLELGLGAAVVGVGAGLGGGEGVGHRILPQPQDSWVMSPALPPGPSRRDRGRPSSCTGRTAARS